MGAMNGRAPNTAIEVRGLRKAFGERPVLWDLDLSVAWGESLVIFGANGVGKTTLLKVLSTQARPDGGTVLVAGVRRGRNNGLIRRMIGVVGHGGMLYEDMTCRENLVFYGRMYSLERPGDRADEALGWVGLEGRSGQRAGTLSHGMYKRLSIARALLHNPRVLLMDEPEAGLDQEALELLGGLMERWRDEGRAVVMTTHNLDQGLAWGQRVAILSGGRIAFQGDRDSLDVAGFRGVYRRYVAAAQ